MITEKEFLKALAVVKAYQKQINGLIFNRLTSNSTLKTLKEDSQLMNRHITRKRIFTHEPLSKTPIAVFVKRNTMSTRLANILNGEFGDQYLNVEYVEDITKENFLKIRNSGQKSWEEFEKLTNQK